MHEIEEIKRLGDVFFDEAKKFIAKQKKEQEENDMSECEIILE